MALNFGISQVSWGMEAGKPAVEYGQIDSSTKFKTLVNKDYENCSLISIHKADDIQKLKEILKNIDDFSSATVSADRNKIFQNIGTAASQIHFNDEREGCHSYIRNKYGFTDRSHGGKLRKGGVKFSHLAALRHLTESDQPLDIDPSIYKELVAGFSVIKKKIQFIIDLEMGRINKTAEEILEFLEASKDDQESDKKLSSFVGYHYSKILTHQMLKILSDENLTKLDFRSRGDRYYLGMVLSMIGELSKDLIELWNPVKEKGLFVFFKRIRDKKLAHSMAALVMDLDDIQLAHLKFLLQKLLLVNFQTKVTSIKEALGTWKGDTGNFVADLGATSLEAKQLLKKLVESIFKKGDMAFDLARLEKALEAPSTVVTNTQIRPGKREDKPEKKGPPNILFSINDYITKYYKFLGSTEKGHPEHVAIQKKKALKLMKEFNEKKGIDGIPKFPSTTEMPTIAQVEELIAAVRKLDSSLFTPLGKNPAEKKVILTNTDGSDNFIDNNGAKAAKKKSSPVDDIQMRQGLKLTLKMISKELNYIVEVLRNEQLIEKKRDYITRFALTKVGQLLRDLEKESGQIIVSTHDAHKQSVRDTITARNKLMHDIIASLNLPISNTLFRKTLPMIPEISALIEILKREDTEQDDDSALFKLGMAYVKLGQFERALEYFGQLLLLSSSEINIDDKIISKKERQGSTSRALNSILGVAQTYGAMAKEKLLTGKEAKSLYSKQVETYQLYLDSLDKLGMAGRHLHNQRASVHSSLGNAYSHAGDFDNAIKEHKSALACLDRLTYVDQAVYALYLYNLGSTFVKEMQAQLWQCARRDTISTESIRKMRLAGACLREAKEIFDSNKVEQRGSFYIKTLCYLITALMCGATPDDAQYLYAKELYAKLEGLEKEFIGRGNSEELLGISELKECANIFITAKRDNEVKEEIRSKFNNQRPLFDAEMDYMHLQLLRTFFLEVGIERGLDDRINSSKLILNKFHPNELSLECLFQIKVVEPNDMASIYFRQGNFQKALELYQEAKLALDEYPEYFTEVLGDLLENIGDTYLKLHKLDDALESFQHSLEIHLQYGPTDRGFKLPLKIIKLNSEKCSGASIEWALNFTRETLQKLSVKVGNNDYRLGELHNLEDQLQKKQASTVLSENSIKDSILISDNINHVAHGDIGAGEECWFRALSEAYRELVLKKKGGGTLAKDSNLIIKISKNNMEAFKRFLLGKLNCGKSDFEFEEVGDGKLCISIETDKAAQAMKNYVYNEQ